MKKQYLPLALALALCQNLSAQNCLDATAQGYVNQYLNAVQNPEAVQPDIMKASFFHSTDSRSEVTADFIAYLNEGTTAENLEAYGIKVRTILGKEAYCIGAMSDIIALSESDLALRISFPPEVECYLDKARAESGTGIDQVYAGEGLEMPYTGKGVIAGIFDIGMDPNHANFLTKDLSGSRVKKLWVYDDNGNATIYDTPQAIANFTTDRTDHTHGTHTMGCMAGSYEGNGDYYTVSALGTTGTPQRNKPLPFRGSAPEAEIIAGCGSNSIYNIVLSCETLMKHILESGKPGVINLSFGIPTGSHDNFAKGTAALNEIAKQVPLFISAGNDGETTNTLAKTFTAGEKSVKTFISSIDGSDCTGNLEIWSGDYRPLNYRFVIYDRTAKKEIFSYDLPGSTDTDVYLASSNNQLPGYITDEAFDLVFGNRSTINIVQKLILPNTRCQTSIRMNTSIASGNGSQRYVFGIEISGEEGQSFDLVNYTIDSSIPVKIALSDMGVDGWTSGNADMSISSLACGDNMICIGSWNTRNRWANLNGKVISYPGGAFGVGKISPFSSYGPLADGRTLPLVCAPGAGIISSISSAYYSANGLGMGHVAASTTAQGKSHYYQTMQGTSMSSPIAAGIGALWLQANPQLTPADIRYIIENTSTDPNDPQNKIRWGAGKMNAIEGIKMAVKIGAGVSDVTLSPADIIITAEGNNWQVVAPGASSVKTVVYDLNGRPVITSDVNGDTAEICGENLQPGIYILNVNGILSRRVAVK